MSYQSSVLFGHLHYFCFICDLGTAGTSAFEFTFPSLIECTGTVQCCDADDDDDIGASSTVDDDDDGGGEEEEEEVKLTGQQKVGTN